MAAKDITVLITGFGPFPGAWFNPTPRLVAELMRLRRPFLADLRRIGHVFTTSYAAVEADLPRLLAEHDPDVVLMFGLAARTPYLRIETLARNVRSGLLADAAGERPAVRGIVAGTAALRQGRAPFGRIAVAMRAQRLPVRLSRDAGRYLCNYLYWRALELVPDDRLRPVLFVHVPTLAVTRRPRRPGRRRAMVAGDLVAGGEAVLRLLVAGARRR